MHMRDLIRVVEGASLPEKTEGSARKDAADENDRVFLAYCRKHKLKISDMSDKEVSHRYAEALASRDQYPIPMSDNGFLYHGTDRANLSSIAQHGLRLSAKANTRGSALVRHSLQRLFFTDTIRSAMFYASRASGSRPTVMLRVRRDRLDDAQTDAEDSDSVFVTHGVPPNQIEFWNGKGWLAVNRFPK